VLSSGGIGGVVEGLAAGASAVIGGEAGFSSGNASAATPFLVFSLPSAPEEGLTDCEPEGDELAVVVDFFSDCVDVTRLGTPRPSSAEATKIWLWL
jgi:hypothetical protein